MSAVCASDLHFVRLERHLRGQLEGDEAERERAHLATCAICQAEERALAGDRALLTAAGADLGAGMVSGARAIASEALHPSPRRVRPRWGALATGAVALAAIVVAVLLAPWLWHRSGAAPEQSRMAQHAPRPVRPGPALPSVPVARPEVVLAAGMAPPRLGEDAQIVLVPGAVVVVTVADGSALSFAEGAQARIGSGPAGTLVALDAGSVEARVTHQPAGHTFAVRAGGTEVLVRGTRFLVRQREPEPEVIVFEGSVEVRRSGRPAELAQPAPGAPTGTNRALDPGSPCGPGSDGPAGTLRVAGEGEVQVDGVALGPAPLEARCSAGMHEVRRGDTAAVAVQIDPGGTSTLAAAPPRASAPHAPTVEPDPMAEARQLLAQRKYAEARLLLEPVVRARPSDMGAMFLLGDARRLSGDAAAAEQAYEQVARSGPSLAATNALARLAFLAERNGPAAALAAWDRYLQASPHGPVAAEALLRRANALVSLGRRAEARAALERFLRDFPDHPRRAEVEERLRTGGAAP